MRLLRANEDFDVDRHWSYLCSGQRSTSADLPRERGRKMTAFLSLQPNGELHPKEDANPTAEGEESGHVRHARLTHVIYLR